MQNTNARQAQNQLRILQPTLTISCTQAMAWISEHIRKNCIAKCCVAARACVVSGHTGGRLCSRGKQGMVQMVQTWSKQHQFKIYLTKYRHTWPTNLLTSFHLDLRFSWSYCEIPHKNWSNNRHLFVIISNSWHLYFQQQKGIARQVNRFSKLFSFLKVSIYF